MGRAAVFRRNLICIPLLFSHSLSFRSIPFALRAMSSAKSTNQLVIDPFCERQFNNPDYTGTHVNFDVIEFENKVNEYFESGLNLVDGYAPFW